MRYVLLNGWKRGKMNRRHGNFKRTGILAVLIGCFALGISACANTSGEAQGSCITLAKEGTVTDCIRESFDKAYYNVEELREQILQTVVNYNSRTGAENITVEKIQLNGDVTDVKMTFATPEDYAEYNREIFFVGTPQEAKEAGFDLNYVFISTEDVTQTMGEAELLISPGMKVLITDTDQSVNLYHKILFVSDKVQLTDRNRTFRRITEDNDQTQKAVCIIFKE